MSGTIARQGTSSAASSSLSRPHPSNVYRANASIWPVQLRDRGVGPSVPAATTVPGRKKLSYVPVKQLDFEDVSYYFDFAYLIGSEGQTLRNHDQEHIDLANGKTVKRKRSPSDPVLLDGSSSAKRKNKDVAANHEVLDRARLIDTCCYFRIKARESQDTDLVLAAKERQQSTSSPKQAVITDLKFSVSSSSSTRPEDSIITHTIYLHDSSTDKLIAELPVLGSTSVTDGNDADAGKLTNGQWLTSLSTMLTKNAGRDDDSLHATFSMEVVSPPSDFPSDRLTAGSLFLKLTIQVDVNVSTNATGPLAKGDRILDMARIGHFADRFPDPIARNEEVDASFVYQNLRPASLDAPDAIQPVDLDPTLLPFQKRSTTFVLGREGMVMSADGDLSKSSQVIGHDGPSSIGLWWKQVKPDLYYNWIEARFVRDPSLTLHSNFKGAMLAEEMGLGKTVEAVALMLLNPDPDAASRPGWYDDRNEIDVTPTKTTLIVAPETLRAQWIEEIGRHAPGLAVYSYKDRSKAEKDVPDGLTWETWAQRFDVMVISYHILSRELNTAKKAPERSRRQERKYERPRSPLVKLHFHRVLMDEVQMIGNSAAAETVSMISRGSSIAVSGTPVKKIDDLRSCFRFLRVPGYMASNPEWQAMMHPLLAPALVRVLRTIGTRHTKALVASEMSLPLQTRTVIPIDFTSIETAFYADLWNKALTEIAYTQEGDPQTPDQLPDVARMRQHLLLLRQACTHPEVAVQLRQNVVGSKNLRSIDEVLELMIDTTRTELHSRRTFWFDRRIHRNILALYRRTEDQRVSAASQLNDVENEINQDVRVLEEEIREARKVGPLYRFTDQELELEQRAEMRKRRLELDDADAKHDEVDDHTLEVLGGDLQAYVALKEKQKIRATHVTQLKALLRNLLMKLHRLLAFTGNLYYQRGEHLDELEKSARAWSPQLPEVENLNGVPVKLEPDPEAQNNLGTQGQGQSTATPALTSSKDAFSEMAADNKDGVTTPKPAKLITSPERQALKDQEDAAYARAEKVRQRLLVEAGEAVQSAVAKLDRGQTKLNAATIRASDELFESGGGLVSSDSYDTLASSARLLNRHAEVLFTWRENIITRLVRAVNRDVSLEREDDDQYQENLDTQAEAEVLLEMYRPLLSEREKILKGSVAVGSTDKPLLYKQIEGAVRVARQNELRGIVPEEGTDEDLLRVQKQQLEQFKKLDQERQSVSLNSSLGSFQYEAEHLRTLRDNTLSAEEATLARQAYVEARRIMAEQIKFLEKLRNEEKLLISPLFNARNQYFKEIQVLSDTVRDPIFMNLETAIRTTQREEADLVTKVDELERRLRYLTHLQMVQSADQLDEAAKTCNICTDLIQIGILTNKCGHVCCEDCWKEWQSQGYRTCVLCQTRVLPNEVHRIVYSNPERPAQDGQVVSNSDERTSANPASNETTSARPLGIRYHELDDALRSALNRSATQGRFGSKIDHVTKHVRLIIDRTGEKSIIFSSFGKGLDVVAQSLTANGIRFVRMTGQGKSGSEAVKSFRSDPSVHVMLLHSEVQSAGLNLLAASHIHILEPLLNTSIELQAIGRVHRIGQTKQTHIWCYYVRDTVEERILALSAYKGQSLYLEGRHTSLAEGPSTLEASAASSSSSSNTDVAALSREDAKKWSAFGKGNKTGAGGTMRGDVTNNSAELLACFFARYLPDIGRRPGQGLRGVVDATTSGSSTEADVQMTDSTAPTTNGQASEQEEDELTKLRRARLAALEQRQATNQS